MKQLIIFLLIPAIFSAQNEIATFSFEKDYNIQPHLSFSNETSNFLICSNLINDHEENLVRGKLNILKFDKEFNYIRRNVIVFKDIDPKKIIVKEVGQEKGGIVELTFFYENTNGIDVYSGELKISNMHVINITLKYSVVFPEGVNTQNVNFFSNEQTTYLLCVDSKNRTLISYKLKRNESEITTFQFEKITYKSLKNTLNAFKPSGLSTKFLDESIGFQYHFYKEYLFLVSINCSEINTAFNQACASFLNSFPIRIIRLNLKTGEMGEKIITENRKVNVAYNILDDKLFYSKATNDNISINKINLKDFSMDSLVLNKGKYRYVDFKYNYAKYNTDSNKIEKENVEFKKFYKKFKKKPALLVQKMSDSIYGINIGNVQYKGSNSFGGWLGSFATTALIGGLTSFATGGMAYATVFTIRNDIPKIYQTSFSVDINSNLVIQPNIKISDPQRDDILNNLDYFIKKKLVFPLNSPKKGEPIIMLYRHKNNWKKFYIYKFPN